MDFSGEIAVVTGGGGDIGRHVGSLLLRGGAKVGLLDADKARLDEAALWLQGADDVLHVAVDLTDRAATDRAIDTLVRRLGPPSILVNAAGIGQFSEFLDVEPDDWERIIDINLNGPVHCARRVLPYMLEAGRGTIVNVCSIWASRGGPNRSAYIASKHGLLGATRALAEEFRDRGIYVCSVSPGPVVTGMTRTWGTSEELARWMQPDEIARVIAYSVSMAGTLIGSDIHAFGRGKPAGL